MSKRQWQFHAGGGAQAPKSWIDPKFSRTLDTLWSVDYQTPLGELTALPQTPSCI